MDVPFPVSFVHAAAPAVLRLKKTRFIRASHPEVKYFYLVREI